MSKGIPFTADQSRSKAAENGRKGGIASGESKRKKKHAKQIFGELMTAEVTAKNINGEWIETTAYDAMCAAMMRKAINGDTKAAQIVFDLIGDSLNAEKLKLDNKRFKAERQDAVTANTVKPVEIIMGDQVKEWSE